MATLTGSDLTTEEKGRFETPGLKKLNKVFDNPAALPHRLVTALNQQPYAFSQPGELSIIKDIMGPANALEFKFFWEIYGRYPALMQAMWANLRQAVIGSGHKAKVFFELRPSLITAEIDPGDPTANPIVVTFNYPLRDVVIQLNP